PAQPRLLHDVLGVGRRAQHLVGDGEQQAAVPCERVLGHATPAYPLERSARGRSQTAEKPWEAMPIAMCLLALRFAQPIAAVSSTRAPGPIWSMSDADISSVTCGGVSLMASA